MNKPTYTENPNETDTKHNSKTKEALSLLSENPELQDALRDKLDGILKRVMDDISRQSVEMSNTMLAYGVQICPEVAAVWLSGQFQKQAALLNEYYAGIAIAGERQPSEHHEGHRSAPAGIQIPLHPDR